jgi:phospholipid transport system substrate-binding protein
MIKQIAVALLVALAGLSSATVAEEAPAAVVERMNGALLETMQAGAAGAGFEERYAALRPTLEESFAFPTMARLAVGPSWNAIEPATRDEIAGLFARMSIATFADRFDGFGGERFEIVGEAPGPRGAVLVKSRLVRPADDPVGLDYLLREQEGGWRIIDVFLNSKFSELARQRAEFAALLRDGGPPALIGSLERKIDDLRG